jgi:hypothetical protein
MLLKQKIPSFQTGFLFIVIVVLLFSIAFTYKILPDLHRSKSKKRKNM